MMRSYDDKLLSKKLYIKVLSITINFSRLISYENINKINKLVGFCYNYLEHGHVATQCRSPTRCILCRGIDHQARACKHGRLAVPKRGPSPAYVPPSSVARHPSQKVWVSPDCTTSSSSPQLHHNDVSFV